MMSIANLLYPCILVFFHKLTLPYFYSFKVTLGMHLPKLLEGIFHVHLSGPVCTVCRGHGYIQSPIQVGAVSFAVCCMIV